MSEMDELVDSGSRCSQDHPIWLVAEGYGICIGGSFFRGPVELWFAWAFTQPATTWQTDYIHGRDDKSEVRAWVAGGFDSKAEALARIQADIDARRALPFDEARERARLMPV